MPSLNRFAKQRALFLLYLILCTFKLTKSKSSCADIPKLSVIPGFGWDALSSKDMAQSLKVTYEECKLTTDGKYLIPDGTDAVIVKTKHLQISAELIEHWSNYSSFSAHGTKFGVGLGWEDFVHLDASYSVEYQKLKNLQIKYGAFTTRTILQNTLYRIHAAPDAQLSDDLREQFVEVMRYISRNFTENAEYLLQMIVSNYGTHYSKSVDAGATFVKEDYLKRSFLHDHASEKQQIVNSAKLSVLKYISFSTETKSELGSSLTQEYNNALVQQNKKAIGGPNFNDSMTMDKWLSGAGDNLVAIDRSVDWIVSFVSPSKFPNAPLWLLKKTHSLMGEAIKEYYSYNTHKGCTKINSPNFDYNANMDDGSCEDLQHDHSFGGVYQTCQQPRNRDKTDACSLYAVQNVLTGGFSCPSYFSTTELYSQSKIYSYRQNYPWEECSGWWLWRRCWNNDNWKTHQDHIYINTYQCIAINNSKISHTSYQFGGLYSSQVTNVNTKKNTCPPLYRSIDIFGRGFLSICVKNNIDNTNPYALSFGGLTSCKSQLQCPTGYHGRLALVYEGCQINYCINKINTGNEGKFTLLVRPPFINISQEVFVEDTDEVFDDYGLPLRLQDSVVVEEEEQTLAIVLPILVLFSVIAVGMAYWQRNYITTRTHQILLRFNFGFNEGQRESFPSIRSTRDVEMPSVSQPAAKLYSSRPLLKKKNPEVNQAWKSINDEILKKNLKGNGVKTFSTIQ